ncbi:DUF2586 domain-containing protein [Polaribacter sp. MSW13]|uniref:DUF2586 domain-containing protein n=1 Tax=Polaribacter marinus TaxID=2916838 RepID=A0A9X1VRD1_9FLAO|nr:DUF2586 family protein [Polaribacter marinus]MCI2229582.1 DUF2586 domain-containing protein [Polaribacter marinus]
MALNGVSVNRLNGGLGRKNPSTDGVCLLIIGGAVTATSLALKVAKELISVEDAVALGIDPTYDDTNDILAHHHIDEFFRVNPNGNLFVVLDDGTLTADNIKTIVKENTAIKAIGVVRNDEDAPADMDVYVSGYQTIVDELRAESRNISAVLVEGAVFDDETLISAYPDARAYEAENVSIVIAQDPIIRAVKTEHETYAAIGTALGAISVRNVNENIGSVDIENKPSSYRGNSNYTLTDGDRQRWLTAKLQDGRDFNSLTTVEIKALATKGYICVGFYNGYPGYYFTDSHTCTESASDYSRIENNRVWDKAATLGRTSLMPRVKANLLKDPITGFIREIEAAELESLAQTAIETMVSSEEISGVSVYINPEQTISDDSPLVVKGEVVFNDIIHEMSFDLGLTNKLQ